MVPGTCLRLVEFYLRHRVVFAVSGPQLRVVQLSASRYQGVAEFDSVTLVVRSEKVSGNLAGFVIDGRAKQAREKRVKHAVFSGLSPVPKFGNRNGGAKQDLFGLGQTLPSGQNSSISRA